MKMTYGCLSRSGIRPNIAGYQKKRKKKKSEIGPFNLALNTTLAYGYIYSSGMRFFSSEFKLKINKWCLHPRYLYYMYFLL